MSEVWLGSVAAWVREVPLSPSREAPPLGYPPITPEALPPTMLIRLMMMVERRGCRRVEVVSLPPGSFPNPVEAELYAFSGEGGIARLCYGTATSRP